MPDFSNLESLIGPGTVEAAIQFLNKGKYLVRNLKYYPMKQSLSNLIIFLPGNISYIKV